MSLALLTLNLGTKALLDVSVFGVESVCLLLLSWT